eukprot:3941587-Rhodomonas_salina.1
MLGTGGIVYVSTAHRARMVPAPSHDVWPASTVGDLSTGHRVAAAQGDTELAVPGFENQLQIVLRRTCRRSRSAVGAYTSRVSTSVVPELGSYSGRASSSGSSTRHFSTKRGTHATSVPHTAVAHTPHQCTAQSPYHIRRASTGHSVAGA